MMTAEIVSEIVGRIVIRRYVLPGWRVTPSTFALRASANGPSYGGQVGSNPSSGLPI
jgi:hypothetical protein